MFKGLNRESAVRTPILEMSIAESADGRPVFRLTLPIDPSKISTAQQKKFDPRFRRFFKNKKVEQGMKLITLLTRPYASKVQSILQDAQGIELGMAFLYAYPKGTPKGKLIDLAPMPVGADGDNRAKAPIDALALAGWWEDDRLITRHVLAKLRTTSEPRIEIAVSPAVKRNFISEYLF